MCDVGIFPCLTAKLRNYGSFKTFLSEELPAILPMAAMIELFSLMNTNLQTE